MAMFCQSSNLAETCAVHLHYVMFYSPSYEDAREQCTLTARRRSKQHVPLTGCFIFPVGLYALTNNRINSPLRLKQTFNTNLTHTHGFANLSSKLNFHFQIKLLSRLDRNPFTHLFLFASVAD